MEVTIEDGVDGGVIGDAYMREAAPSANYGGRHEMFMNNKLGGNRKSFLIKVDLSSYSTEIIVTSAKYILYCQAANEIFDINLYPSLREWVEGSNDGGNEPGACNAFAARSGSENWTSVNAEGAGTDYDNTTLTATFTAINPAAYVDVVMDTDVVQGRIGSSDFGDIAYPDDRTGAGEFRIHSSEGTNKPQFYFEYSLPVAPPSPLKDISKKDRKILSTHDNITYVAPEAADADTRYEVASEEVEEESNVNHYLAQYKKIVDTSDQIAEILDKRCNDYIFKFNPTKMPALAQAIRKVFGKDTSEITYDMYKQVLDEQIALSEKIGDEIFAQ